MIHWIEAIAFVSGIALAALLSLFPRFGAGSRHLLCLILPACLSAGLHSFSNLSEQDAFRISVMLIILAAGGGYLACSFLNQKAKRIYDIPIGILSILLTAWVYFAPITDAIRVPEGYVALGFAGYIAALFLLIVSVIVLASLEQILRNSDETARWELKFLFLGIGSLYAAIIYLSSQTLLYPPRSGLLYSGAISLFHVMFLASCILIAIAWNRSSGKTQIAVSHGAIYSSITLLSVGVYLIASSLIARMASRWGDLGLPVEALIFLVSAVVLAALLLGTGLRHKTRAWIRRNVFAGRYDYRQFWLEATERIRSIDPADVTAQALADIVHKALGAIDVSVWIRLWNPNRLQVLHSQGTISLSLKEEVSGVIEELLDTSEPLSEEDIAGKGSFEETSSFIKKTKAALLVPLISSNRIVGIITVGSDRSGQKYDWEAREFLRALAGHAAGEFHKSDLLASLVSAKEDEAFRAFSTFVLHDLKNFASTLSYIAQNAPKHQHNPEFQKDAFHSVYDTAEKMKKLCNSLKTFSGSLAANKKNSDLNQIIRSVADTLNAGLQNHLKFETTDVPKVLVDADEVGRVIQNLLLNAREAIAADGVIIVRTANHGDKVEVAVEDNGKGMSREFYEKELFVPFHTTKSGGLGIGLFHSKKIMEAHNGSITVESEEGKGTKITLSFPKN